MLKGTITRTENNYIVDLEWMGYGNMTLREIFEMEKLIKPLEALKVGETLSIER